MEEGALVESLRDLLDLEKSLEKAKQTLAYRRDFTVQAAFKIFNSTRLPKVSSTDIQAVYTSYGIYISEEEAKLIMSRFDRDRDEMLTFEEFADMWIPIDNVFATSLDARGYRDPYATIHDPITKADFLHVLRLTLQVESHAEGVRQRLAERPFFNKSDAFDTLNKFDFGFLTREDFAGLFKKHRFYATNKELNMLMDRFDKDKDEKISYNEFIAEITPHSPYKY